MYRLRPATKTDAPAIRKLIWQVHINPMDLNWKHFTVLMMPTAAWLAASKSKAMRMGVANWRRSWSGLTSAGKALHAP